MIAIAVALAKVIVKEVVIETGTVIGCNSNVIVVVIVLVIARVRLRARVALKVGKEQE